MPRMMKLVSIRWKRKASTISLIPGLGISVGWRGQRRSAPHLDCRHLGDAITYWKEANPTLECVLGAGAGSVWRDLAERALDSYRAPV